MCGGSRSLPWECGCRRSWSFSGTRRAGRARKELATGSELWGQMQLEVLASVPGRPGCPLSSLGLTAGPGAEQWWERDTLHMRGGCGGGGNGRRRKDGEEWGEWQGMAGMWGTVRGL